MIDAMYNGISGLNIFETALNTETNNISNVNTVGYKSDQISFADQMYQKDIGKGVNVAIIDKQFKQGNIKVTNGTYDMAIEGKGFFIVKGETNEINYTRAGNFRIDSDGTLRLPNGYQVQGIPAKNDSILSSDNNQIFTSLYTEFLGSQVITNDIDKSINTLNSKSTNYNLSAQNDPDSKTGDNYKTASSKIRDADALSVAYRDELSLLSSQSNVASIPTTNQVSEVNYNLNQLSNTLDRVEIYIGNTKYTQAFRDDAITTLKDLSDQISSIELFSSSVDVNGKLTITSMLPGKSVNIADAKIINGSITASPIPTINTTSAIIGSGQARLDSFELALKDSIEKAGGKYLRINSSLSENNLSSTSISELQLKLTTLNVSENAFGKISVENGNIFVNQEENKFIVGKVVTAVFTNELGLDPQGGNLYSATTDSGDMIFGTTENKIRTKMLELSNSNLSESLVSLMTLQRSFEASSRSVTTSDEFLKTAIQLKK